MKKSTRILIPVLLLAVLAGILPACNKEQTAYDKQETNIAKFVEAQCKADTTATVTYLDGTVRVVLHDTLRREGLMAETLRPGGTVSFYYAGYTLSGASVTASNLFATNLFSGKYAYGSHIQGTIPARSALVYHIWVNSISND